MWQHDIFMAQCYTMWQYDMLWCDNMTYLLALTFVSQLVITLKKAMGDRGIEYQIKQIIICKGAWCLYY